MLEFYRPNADYTAIMRDLEGALSAAEQAVAPARGLLHEDAVRAAHGARRAGSLRRARSSRSRRWAVAQAGGRCARRLHGHVDLASTTSSFTSSSSAWSASWASSGRAFLIEYPRRWRRSSRLKPGEPEGGRARRAVRGWHRAGERLLRADRRGRAAQAPGRRAGAGAANEPSGAASSTSGFLDAVGKLPECRRHRRGHRPGVDAAARSDAKIAERLVVPRPRSSSDASIVLRSSWAWGASRVAPCSSAPERLLRTRVSGAGVVSLTGSACRWR
jgi:hypothetical protein